jgi:MFS family permease
VSPNRIVRRQLAVSVLGERDFRLLFFGQAISMLGGGMVAVALAFAVLDVTGSVAALGLVSAAYTVPSIVFLLVGGVMADRVSRRGMMLAADTVRACTQCVLALLLLTGSARLWEIVVLQVITGAAGSAFMPASSALTTELLPAERLQEGNALRSLSRSASSVLGPALGGVLVALTSAGWAIAVDAASFAVGAGFLAMVRAPSRRPAPGASIMAELREGWNAYWSRRWLVVGGLHAAVMNMMVVAPLFVLGPAVAKRDLGGAGAWALIVASFGVGALIGDVISMRIRVRRRAFWGCVLWIVGVGPLALLALRAPALAVAPFSLIAGVHGTFLNTMWETSLQEEIAPELLSRVVAYDWLGALLFVPLGFALTGLLAAGPLGLSETLWLGVAVGTAATALIAFAPSIRAVGVDPRSTA